MFDVFLQSSFLRGSYPQRPYYVYSWPFFGTGANRKQGYRAVCHQQGSQLLDKWQGHGLRRYHMWGCTCSSAFFYYQQHIVTALHHHCQDFMFRCSESITALMTKQVLIGALATRRDAASQLHHDTSHRPFQILCCVLVYGILSPVASHRDVAWDHSSQTIMEK